MTPRSRSTSSVDRGVPSERSSSAASAAGRGVEGQRDQHGALALDEVVAGRLAGGGRVAEDAEQVVAQLERLAQRQPERRQLGQRRRGRAGERGAEVERSLDGVLGRLVAQHRHRGVDVGVAAGLGGDVEELAGDHLGAAQVEDVERRGHGRQRQPAAAQQLVGPRQQQVAEEDRAGRAVLLRVAAPARRRGARARRCGASTAGRGGCRRRPCSRRARGRWRAAAPARRRPGPARRRRSGGATARWPHQQNDARNILPPATDVRASATSRAASGPSGCQPLGLLVEEGVERGLDAGPEAVLVPRRRSRRDH